MSSDAFDQTADAGTGNKGPVALAPGTFLGKYRLDRILGEGGMGVVWAAHDPDLERAVAIKVLRYAQASQQLRQRLLREARAMAKLKHPNVLTVYEVGTVGDRDYIAMELVDGRTLDDWLALHPTEDERWTSVLAAGRGLAAAHEAGVVHRDFKPHNVLRSREGRVLVTDFGLARGMLAEQDSAALGDDHVLDAGVTPYDETLEAKHAAATPKPASLTGDSLLDAPLTQTGALIGTPAYMSPEQYRGAPPDPRTDQFAFCVTAWQALTGERPFKGTTLDEMRRSASGGVAHIETKLPRELRAVLARGLDPDASKRWPSMEVLLDALVRAHDAPRRRRLAWTWALAGLLLVAGIVLALAMRANDSARTGCDDPDAQFAEAWSPDVRRALAKKTHEANVVRIGDQLDRYSERWIESYAKACRSRTAKVSRQRLACLEGIRDNAAALTTMLGDVEPHVLDMFEPRDALPTIASCETQSPLAPPRVTKEQPRRDRILRVMGKSLALRGTPTERLAPAIDALLAEAKPLGWPPLAPLVLVSAAGQYMRADQPALARATYERAIASLPADAELRDVRVEGSAYLGLLDTSLAELENPSSAVPPGIKDPKAKVPLHGELAVRITKATNAAGADPLLLGARSLLAAVAYSQAAQWNRYASGYDEALQLIAQARQQFDAIGDVQRSAYAAAIEADIYLQRGDDRALDDALFAARRAQDALAAAKLPPLPQLDHVRAQVAFARRDYSELYRIKQATGGHELAAVQAPTVRGRVVGDNAGSAVVIAWPSELVGNPRRIASGGGQGHLVRADRDGSFDIAAHPGWAIMAETQDARSSLQLVGDKPVALKLEPTTTISGRVQGRNWFGVKAFARYELGGRHWTLEVPIDKDGTFDLRGLPPGPRSYGTSGPAGTGVRTIVAGANAKAISWSSGQAIEAIVRATQLPANAHVVPHVVMVRGGHDIKTRAALDALLATAPDVARSDLVPIGADNTDAGREHYRAGDRHAVITGNHDGPYTVCVVLAAPACKTITVAQTVAIDYPDGRFAAGVTPIVFD